MRTTSPPPSSNAVAVYCASSLGKQKAFQNAALSVGRALAATKRPLIYGGGFHGIMGLVAEGVIDGGGQVTGIVPYAIMAAGGERDKVNGGLEAYLVHAQSRVETIVVDSMHERKVEMAKRAVGFLGLPGGFGTFEEVLEVVTWTQIGIHDKPVVLLNVLSFWDPLRDLVQNGIREGFIQPQNEQLIVFVDGPSNHHEHETFDWGTAALDALDAWHGDIAKPLFDWSKRMGGEIVQSELEST